MKYRCNSRTRTNRRCTRVSSSKHCFQHRKECSLCDVRGNIITLECQHELCCDCVSQLRSFLCPFCRTDIRLSLPQIDRDRIERRIDYDKLSDSVEFILRIIVSSILEQNE